ncbi:MFS transporter [Paraburkholderia tropica]|uniref:hypothetical protein n=1 Tax=Paraburkholderia tropica TaxID=92647 RepID=UPI002AB74F4B|nr:hypothetical protein [Paraburkholderia tropica]
MSDKVGRRLIFDCGLYGDAVIAIPSWLVAAPNIERLAIAQIILCSVIGVIYGPLPTSLSDQFVTRTRSTGLAVSYNIAFMVFRDHMVDARDRESGCIGMVFDICYRNRTDRDSVYAGR